MCIFVNKTCFERHFHFSDLSKNVEKSLSNSVQHICVYVEVQTRTRQLSLFMGLENFFLTSQADDITRESTISS
jgi:hypothetical protein